MTLPRLLPLPKAAHALGLSESELRERVKTGTISAGEFNGEILVNVESTDINEQLRAIRKEDFEHLRGQPITVTEAAEKYNISRVTVFRWAKQGYIKILTKGYRLELDEADVSFCAAIHTARKQAGIISGFPLLDENGQPNILKHPNLSRYRREQREAARLSL